jgi:putative restriction endonuclease
MSTAEEKWLRVAAHLRVDRSRGPAPHKPLLLLVMAELADAGKLRHVMPLNGELTFRFLVYWAAGASKRPTRPDIRLPFFHLHGDGCWTPLDEAGKPTLERSRTTAVRFDEAFLGCLLAEGFRRDLRRVLISTYFAREDEQVALFQLVGMRVPTKGELREDARRYEQAKESGREARFRLTVVPAYDYTCALTGYRCVTVGGGSIVDAAHIHQFSDSRNNDPRNGLALSKNAHWMFDAGLWSLDDDFRILVAPGRFDELGAEAFLLQRKQGHRLQLPSNRDLWPAKEHLAWHRARKFNPN